jgi:hypothetical protein
MAGKKKVSANEAIRALCKELDYDPLRELIELAKEKRPVKLANGEIADINILEPRERIAIAKEIAPYIHPKYKGVEVEQDVNDEIKITIQRKSDKVVPPRNFSENEDRGPSEVALLKQEQV